MELQNINITSRNLINKYNNYELDFDDDEEFSVFIDIYSAS